MSISWKQIQSHSIKARVDIYGNGSQWITPVKNHRFIMFILYKIVMVKWCNFSCWKFISSLNNAIERIGKKWKQILETLPLRRNGRGLPRSLPKAQWLLSKTSPDFQACNSKCCTWSKVGFCSSWLSWPLPWTGFPVSVSGFLCRIVETARCGYWSSSSRRWSGLRWLKSWRSDDKPPVSRTAVWLLSAWSSGRRPARRRPAEANSQ